MGSAVPESYSVVQLGSAGFFEYIVHFVRYTQLDQNKRLLQYGTECYLNVLGHKSGGHHDPFKLLSNGQDKGPGDTAMRIERRMEDWR